MSRLWRTIEESPLLMDVKDVWRERLEMEFEPLGRFLEATNIVATRLPGRTTWSSFKVVVNDDSFVTFCESTGESREVPRADVICHQLNSRQLAAELNAALSLGRKPEWLDSSRRVWFLGNLSLELQSRPVYMSLHIASDLITEALHVAAAEYLILQDLWRLKLLPYVGWIRGEWHSRPHNFTLLKVLVSTHACNIDRNVPHDVGMFIAHRLEVD